MREATLEVAPGAGHSGVPRVEFTDSKTYEENHEAAKVGYLPT